MTPQQKIKHLIIAKVFEWESSPMPVITADNIDLIYDNFVENDQHYDAMNEIREGEVETDLRCDYSRNYESKAVAAKALDGSWVGWTYWYGGGKHGQPTEVEWMCYAYDLSCVEEEKVVTVRTFAKVSGNDAA